MNTTAKVQRDTARSLSNLIIAVGQLELYLREEGRFVSANQLDLARRALEFAEQTYDTQTPGHD